MTLTSSIDEPDRVGIEIRRDGDLSWRDTVARYARTKDLAASATDMFDGLVNDGVAEPWAALRVLDIHGCTDLIVDAQHLNLAKIRRTLT